MAGTARIEFVTLGRYTTNENIIVGVLGCAGAPKAFDGSAWSGGDRVTVPANPRGGPVAVRVTAIGGAGYVAWGTAVEDPEADPAALVRPHAGVLVADGVSEVIAMPAGSLISMVEA